MTERTVTIAQANAAQRVLRTALGLGEERFPVPAFIGMLSDEIEQLRDHGRDDATIAAMIAEASGLAIDAKDVTDHYAPPDRRAHG